MSLEELFTLKRKKTKNEDSHGPVLSLAMWNQQREEAAQTKILVMAHNHPDLYPGGGEIMAYQLFQAYRAQPETQARFLAATGNVSRKAHLGTAFLGQHNRPDEFLFHADQFDYFHLKHRQPEILLSEFKQFLLQEKPDIIHLHHLLRFGIEVLPVIKQTLPEAQIFLTLHDFIPMCHRDGQMLTKPDDTLCESANAQACHGCFAEKSPVQFKVREVLIKQHLQMVDAFISPSQFLAQRYIKWGLPEEKMHVIANGSDHAEQAPHRALGEEETRNNFGYFGQISKFKGVEVLLDAAALLKQQDYAFSLAIHGDLSNQTKEFQADFHARVEALKGYVQFDGRYKPDQMPKRMAPVDWVVMPSIWWENAPLVIGEAQFHQRPVICSGIGGMAELIEDGVNGLHCQPSNAQDLARVMARAMDEEGLWDACAKQSVLPPSSAEMAQQYRALFEEYEVAASSEEAEMKILQEVGNG